MEKWVIKNRKADFSAIMKKFGISEIMARLLVNKGYTDEKEISNYLYGTLNELNSCHLMKDVDKVCHILIEKIKSNKKIRVVGDYDVDGIMSVYILIKALEYIGADADYEIPDRIKDGYGINISIMEQAYKDGIDTILTCDNGISAIEPVKAAKSMGMTVIITDHHDIPYEETDSGRRELLPEADAIINPKQSDCKYPFKKLCGAVVAYKLVEGIYEYLGKSSKEVEKFIEYAGIATVCDVMDLVGENRIIVKESLKKIGKCDNSGLKALIECNNISVNNISAYHLGYIIGPCLNASGRLDTAKKGLELLFSEEYETAEKKALELKKLNDIRKEMTAEGVLKAVKLIEKNNMLEDKVLVIYLDDCHESLAGIIAGRIKEKYNRPVFVLTDANDSVKGSGRSIEAYSMFDELVKCKELLLKFGGHPMAAGLSLEKCNIENFRRKLNENTILKDEDFVEKVSIDVVLPLGYVGEELVDDLKILEPFGKGNSKPVFAERNIRIKRAWRIGKNNNVLKLKVINEYNKEIEAMYFGEIDFFEDTICSEFGENAMQECYRGIINDVKLSLTYYPSVNEYNGFRNVQITVMNYLAG